MFLGCVQHAERERVNRLFIIVELAQQYVSIVCYDRAGSISVVFLNRFFAFHQRDQVFGSDRHLHAYCRRCFTGRYPGNISQGDDVRISFVNQCRFINHHPGIGSQFAFRPSQTGLANEIGSRHRRSEMKEIIIFHEWSIYFLFSDCFNLFKMYLFGCRIDTFHANVEIDGNITFLVNLQQTGSIKRNIVQLFRCCEVIQFQIVPCALFAAVIFCQQTNLFRCSATFMLCVCICVDTTAACLCEFLKRFPGFLCTFVIIYTVSISCS